MLFDQYTTVSIEGGNGGGGGNSSQNMSGGNGGAGGHVRTIPRGANLEIGGDFTLLGGNGGKGGNAPGGTGKGGDGGTGGNAEFDGANTSVAVTGTFAMSSGLTGMDGTSVPGATSGAGGAGGSATFTAACLSAPTIELTKNGGGLMFTVDTLNVDRNTEFKMEQATAGGTLDVSVNGLVFSGGSTLAITAQHGATFANGGFGGDLSVTGSGNRMTMNGIGTSFDASNAALSFVMDGSETNGGTMLDASGSGGITIDNGTTLSLTGTSSLVLNQSVTLANTITGTLNSTYQTTYTLGRRTFTVSQGGANANLLATVTALQSYLVAQNAVLPPNFSNLNLEQGALYLDRVEQQLGSSAHPLMVKLDAAFTAATDPALGGWGNRVALGQLYGEYAAYANTAQSVTSGQFGNLWQRRNSDFLNGVVFATPAAAAGVASPQAFPSLVHGARDCVPAGKSRIWAGGFGSWANQDSRDNLAGYKYDSYGAALGYEYAFNNCLQLGLAAAYSRGDLKVDDLRYENKPDILNLALYGVYAHQSGVYAKAGLGYSHAWNDYTVNMIVPPGGQKKGKYGSDDWSADLELGYVARLPKDFNLIPSVGLEYDYLKNGGWTEALSGNPALVSNRFDSGHDSSLDIPLGLRFNKMFTFGSNGGYVIPEVRAQWVYMADKARASIQSGYAGAPGSATMYGVDPGNNYWRLGAGISGRFNQRVDFRVDYDFDTRSGFRGHNVLAAVGVAF